MIHLRKPKETIQKIGESDAVVPEKVAADLGITDLFISNQAQDIRFTGEGEQTNVGERIPDTTKGMTVNGTSGGVSRPDIIDIYPEHSVSRTAISAGEVSRPVRGINRPDIARRTSEMADEYDEPEIVEAEIRTTERDDFSDLVEISEDDMDDIFGTGERRRKSVNRTAMRKRQPIRGQANPPTAIRSVRL